MSDVKRYEHAGDYCGPRCGFEESADGDWVFASDYDALAQRCRELDIEASRLSGWLGACDRERLAAQQERDALARRCRELEQCMSEPLNKLVRERDTLRAEVEQLREIREIAIQCAENGGYLNGQGLIELRELLRR